VRVALVCPTVGQTRRGYERFITDLFALVRSDVDITLFKGGGKPAPGEVVVRHMSRTGLVARLAGERAAYTRSRLEFATFAVALWPHLLRGKFDVVHFIDAPLARKLSRMRGLARSRYRLVYTDGGPAAFDAMPYADLIHYVTPAARDAALAAGAPAERTSMLPVGVNTGGMAKVRERGALRRELGVGTDTFVILAVTTLNRHHKRVDYLIDEIARLPGDILLRKKWDGGPVVLAQKLFKAEKASKFTSHAMLYLGDGKIADEVLLSQQTRPHEGGLEAGPTGRAERGQSDPEEAREDRPHAVAGARTR